MAGQGTVSVKAYNETTGREDIGNVALVAGNIGAGVSKLQVIPALTKFAQIQAEGGDMKYTDDGTVPTIALGQRLYDGQVLEYEGPLANLRFFVCSGAPKLNVAYYK